MFTLLIMAHVFFSLLMLVASCGQDSPGQVRKVPTQATKVIERADGSMSEELTMALASYEEYVNLVPLTEVRPNDLGLWCLAAVSPLEYYVKAPDQHKAPVIEENRRKIERDLLDCINDPRHTDLSTSTLKTVVWIYYEKYLNLHDDVSLDPTLWLVLHRHPVGGSIFRENRFTLSDISDECIDRVRDSISPEFKRCLARRLMDEIPEFRGFPDGYVRGLME